MDEIPASREPDELNRRASARYQEPPPSRGFYDPEPYRRDERTLRFNLLIYSGLLGISTVVLTQLLPISPLDLALRVAVFAFAVAIPALAGSIMADREKAVEPINLDTPWETTMSVAGVLASIVGVTAIFFHFSLFAGCVFFMITVVAIVVTAHVISKIMSINEGGG